MPNPSEQFKRFAWGRYMNRPLVTAQRPENLQALKKRVSQGEGTTQALNVGDLPMGIFGLTDFTDDFYW